MEGEVGKVMAKGFRACALRSLRLGPASFLASASFGRCRSEEHPPGKWVKTWRNLMQAQGPATLQQDFLSPEQPVAGPLGDTSAVAEARAEKTSGGPRVPLTMVVGAVVTSVPCYHQGAEWAPVEAA
ncbi:hypothetical protein TREES_T100004253 [Tupaia chinensis]|uniref:Uncharacterized protein n=1 Tax=Tupaia chinensis TaxID=246437 RepID=L9KHT6_TUPCH|nr:hypothetical protein TREES_T100004253 [Tupaia chinensis]